MLKDVTLGRFYPANSILHRLDSRTKMFSLIVFIISIFLINNLYLNLVQFALVFVFILLSKVPVKYMFRGLRAIALIIILSFAINVFFNDGNFEKALIVMLRMIEIVVCSNILTLTTLPKDISSGLEKSFSFLKKIKVPVHDFATMISIAFRFIPILSSESQRIMDAQKSRGANFESGNLIKRARSLVAIAVPLFVSAFRKADDLSDAMDCRLYGTCEPTNYKELIYRKSDYVTYSLNLIYIALLVGVKIWL